MLIIATSLVILLALIVISGRPKQAPLDRDVILRIRRLAETIHREELLPYE
jgi:hypothetical protein